MGVTVAVTRAAAQVIGGNQDITTIDLGGLTPKAVWFTITEAITDGTAADDAVMGVGAATATDERWAICESREHDVATSDTYDRGVTDECVLKIVAADGTVDGEADFVTFIANGVRINWGNAPAAAYLITATFFAGTDVSAQADVFTMPNVLNGTVDVNTVGFEPDVLLTASNCDDFDDASNNIAEASYGVVINKDPVVQACSTFRSTDAQGVAKPSSRITSTYGIMQIDQAATVDWGGEFGTFDAAGFSCTDRIAATDDDVGFLALAFNGAVDFAAGIIDSPIANGNQSIVAPGFVPQYVHVGLTQMPAIDTAYSLVSQAGSYGFSVFDDDDEYCNSIQDENASDPTDTQSLSDNTVINLPADDGSAAWVASFVSFDANGWTWNFTGSLGTAVKWWYLAIEAYEEPTTTTTTTTAPPTTTTTTTTPPTTTTTTTPPTTTTTTYAPTTTTTTTYIPTTTTTTTPPTTTTTTTPPTTTTTTAPPTTTTTTAAPTTTTTTAAPTTTTLPPTISWTPPVSIPSMFQEVGLSISYGDPLIQSPRATYLGELRGEVGEYEHETAAVGGYLNARFTLAGDMADVNDWYEHGLGRDVRVVGPYLNTVWQGFVNSVSVAVGQYAATVGPLVEITNRVYVVYSQRDTTVDPPTIIPGVITTLAQDTDSQARYGIWEARVTGGETDQTGAELVRDSWLREHKDATADEPRVAREAGGEVSISLECLGYYAWLLAYPYQDVAGSGTVTCQTKVLYILAADTNGVFSADLSHVGYNPALAPRYENSGTPAWDAMKALVALGDANDNRWTFGVYEDRKAHYEQIPTAVAYQHRLTDPAQRIERLGGGELFAWDVQPGRWLYLLNFLTGRGQPEQVTDRRKDPRFVFIESVRFSAPDTVEITGTRVGRLAQILAKQGLGGTGG